MVYIHLGWFAVGSLIGSLIGTIITIIYRSNKTKPKGTLRIDITDPDGPYLFLNLYSNPSELMDLDYVTFNVQTRR